jgi:hypothetical protein
VCAWAVHGEQMQKVAARSGINLFMLIFTSIVGFRSLIHVELRKVFGLRICVAGAGAGTVRRGR